MRISDWSSDVCSFDLCGHAFYAQQTFCDRVIDIPAQLFQRHVRRFGAEIGDGTAINIDPNDLRLYYSFRQLAADLRAGVAHVIDCTVDRRSDRSEEHTSDLQPLIRITYAVFRL